MPGVIDAELAAETAARLSRSERLAICVAIRARMRETLPANSPVIVEFWSNRDCFRDVQLRSIADAHGVEL